MREIDVVIIGAGPAGLSAATYMARSSHSFVLLEKGAPGGRLLTLPTIENYPGFPAVSGQELALSFLNAASSLGIQPEYGAVNSVSMDGNRFLVKTDSDSYSCRAVIVATGITFVPSIPGEKEFLGKGVSYCATCDGRFFKGKPMVVYGNGDEAIQEALYLAPLSSELLFVCPDVLIGAEKAKEHLLSLPNVRLVEHAKLEKIFGNEFVNGVIVNGKEEICAAVFPLSGPKSASSFLSPLGLETKKGFLAIDEDGATSVPGLFAAGDIVDKKLRQVVNAAGEGANAATSAIRYLNKLGK